MTRFNRITTSLMLFPATFALAFASPAAASSVDDVEAAMGDVVDPSHPLDFNCSGVIDLYDWLIAGRVTQIHSTPGFNPTVAVEMSFGDTLADLGENFPFHADLNGDCSIGVPDRSVPTPNPSAQGGSSQPSILEIYKQDLGGSSETFAVGYKSPADLNCDGKVGVPDLKYVAQVHAAENSPHFDKMTAVVNALANKQYTPRKAFYYAPADVTGDCTVGIPDWSGAASDSEVFQ